MLVREGHMAGPNKQKTRFGAGKHETSLSVSAQSPQGIMRAGRASTPEALGQEDREGGRQAGRHAGKDTVKHADRMSGSHTLNNE